MGERDKPDGRQPQTVSAARAITRRLREDILSVAADMLLGSENHLLQRYGCSRATLRQAARLLEHQQLLVVRRGVGGGYYGRRPDLETVTEAAALYLRLRHTSLREVLTASQLLQTETVRLAAASRVPEARVALEQIVATLVSRPKPASVAELLKDDAALFNSLMRMVDNAPLEMFQRTLFTFGQRQTTERIYHGYPDRWITWRRSRVELARAVLAGDGEMAVLLARRQHRMVQDWLSSGSAAAEPFFSEVASGD